MWLEQFLTPENVLAIVGVLVAVGGLAYERLIPGRKRIGYRVQMDAPIDDKSEDHELRQRLRMLENAADLEGASLVLMRIENDGFRAIDREDYITTREDWGGLVATFPLRRVVDVMVTEPSHESLVRYLPNGPTGLRYVGNNNHTQSTEILVPKVPLNRGDFFKLLVVLTDQPGSGPPHAPATLTGRIKEGKVHNNEKFRAPNSRVLGIVISLVLLLVLQPVGFQLLEGAPPPRGCVRGGMTVVGSTAFAPVMKGLATAYQAECPGSRITVAAGGSGNGIQTLRTVAKTEKGFPSYLSMSDGRDRSGSGLTGEVVAVPVFAVVVNDSVDVRNLTTHQITDLFDGDVKDWSAITHGPSLPVRLVGREANSGTRNAFQRYVIERSELAATSADCRHADFPSDKVVRCEEDSTDSLLDAVGATPGAIGYAELSSATARAAHGGLRVVALDGKRPSAADVMNESYPFSEAEYAYTDGPPPPGSLVGSFLDLLDEHAGRTLMQENAALPCSLPQNAMTCKDAENAENRTN